MPTYPLQTRAVWLTPDRLESESRLRKAVEALINKSYNTIIVPVLYEGETLFKTTSKGYHQAGFCMGTQALAILADYDVTIWLGVDPLTAGASGTGKFGSLANKNRHWLMRTVYGNFPPPEHPEIPGLFDWTAIQFRNYLGNILVDLTDAFPIDGVVIDLRNLPETTENPATWTHLGYSSLQRIQRELGLDLEEFLVEPTRECHQSIVKWRYRELRLLLKNLKSRVQRSRSNLPMYFQVSFGSQNSPFAPWAKWDKGQLAESYLLHAPAEELASHVKTFDDLFRTPRPFIVAIDAETDLADLSRELSKVPCNGFCVLHAGPLQRVLMPEPQQHWNYPGAVEDHPVAAATEIVDTVAPYFSDCEFMQPFLKKMGEFLTNAGEHLGYDVALNVRNDLLDMKKRILTGEIEITADATETATMLDRIARLLLLVYVPSVDV